MTALEDTLGEEVPRKLYGEISNEGLQSDGALNNLVHSSLHMTLYRLTWLPGLESSSH